MFLLTGLVTLFGIGIYQLGLQNNISPAQMNMTYFGEFNNSYKTTKTDYGLLQTNLTSKVVTREESELSTGNNLVVAGVKFMTDSWKILSNLDELLNAENFGVLLTPDIRNFIFGFIALTVLLSVVYAILRWYI